MKYSKFVDIINKKLKKKDNNDDGQPVQIPQTKKRSNNHQHRIFKDENDRLHPKKHPKEPSSHANFNHFQGPQI